MVAVLRLTRAALLLGCAAVVFGCGSRQDDASAPVANPPGRLADPTKDIAHPPRRQMTPVTGMTLNTNGNK